MGTKDVDFTVQKRSELTVIEVQDKVKDLQKKINDLLLHFVMETRLSPNVIVIRHNRDIVKISVEL